MKDYSMNLEERKDFILGYDVTKEGMIKIKFAKGKPWYVPYNRENEQILLDKMKKQLVKAPVYEKKLKDKIFNNITASGILLCMVLVAEAYLRVDIQMVIGFSSFFVGVSLIPGVFAIKNKLKLNDLRKNIKFLEMEEKLNECVRKEQNILVDVSMKTKNVITDFPEDRPIFNVNNFNYVPFNDLKQIIENDERNERFGFSYTESEEPHKGIVRKKIK